MTGVIMDGIRYNVAVVFDSMERAFELVEGPCSGTAITGTQIRDILGTGYTYTMTIEPMPDNEEDYDSFYQAISKPVDYHTITVPYNNTTMTYRAAIKSGRDTYGGHYMNKEHWHTLQVEYNPISLQRTS